MEHLLNISSNKLLILFTITSMLCSCHGIKNYNYKRIECQEIPKEAVNIAIADYSKQLKRRKDFSNVTAVELYITYTSTDWFYIGTKPWLPRIDDKSGRQYFADRFEIEELDEYMGKIPPSYIPTQFAEKDNVLYVWHDPQAVLTENLKNVLIKYDLVYYPGDKQIATLDGGDFSYIFCKTNYKKRYYYRVKPRYNTPLPSCRCNKSTDK